MKLDPYRFVEKKKDKLELRPHFGGVYHKNGYIYATDAFVLIKKKADYPKSIEGKVIGKKGDVIGTHYPNADALIHDRSEYEAFSLDVEELDRFVKKLKDDDYESPVYLYDRNMSLKSVSFYDPTNAFQRKYHTAAATGTTGIVLMAIPILKQMVYFMKAEKTNMIWMNKTVSYTKPVMVYGNDSTLLAMPVTGGGDTDWYQKFPVDPVREPAYAPASFRKAKAGPKTVAATPKPKAKPAPKTETKPKTDTTMRRTTTRRKTAVRKGACSTISVAASILKGQKKEYQKIFAAEVKKRGVNSRTAAQKAGSAYRKKYGNTPTERWRRAVGKAKKQCSKIPDLPF